MKSDVLPSRTLGASKMNYSTSVNPTLKIQVFGYTVPSKVAPCFTIKQRTTPVLKKKRKIVAAASRSP